MKAITYEIYGPPDVLQLKEIEKPAPGENEVLVRVQAASVNAADWRMMRADPFLVRLYAGLVRPKKISVLGADIAGHVEAVGRNVSQFRTGDEVFGDMSANGFGGFAEYKCANESGLVLKPSNVSFEEAAAVPLAGLAALHAVRDAARVQAGQEVLINGASGGVGTFAVQLAKHFGAEVTAVCSTMKLDQARLLGADFVVDYTQEDFTRGDRRYDVILALNGFRSILDYRRALRPRGRYVMTGGSSAQLFQALLLGPWLSMAGGRKVAVVSSKPNRQDLQFLKNLLESGKLKAIIDRRYPLRDVADAMRYVEEGHAKGKVVITVRSQSD